ncbi:MAG TPA: fructose-6-phosphate aldolase [Firmicutes bacterium]|jgi:fructose-6-phosphate aldolase 2|nr:fructose-6-phosphate aldolase [Bacillota bacterium]
MLILLDSADLQALRGIIPDHPLDGVTTNPTIISRACSGKREIPGLLRSIRGLLGNEGMLHIQVTAATLDGILAEAETIKEQFGEDVYIKIPVTSEGIKALSILAKKGIRVTATAVFTPQQALIAAKAGADFVAPYVNRLDDLAVDGSRVVREIKQIFTDYSLKTRVLAASFRNIEQVHRVCLSGADAVTISPELYWKMLFHPLTAVSVEEFERDWAAIPEREERN